MQICLHLFFSSYRGVNMNPIESNGNKLLFCVAKIGTFFFLPLAQCPSKITSWRTQMLQWVTQCFQNLITWVSPCSKLPLIAVLPCIMDKDNYWTIVTEQCVMLTSKYIFSHHMPFPLRHIPSSYSVLLPTPCHTTNCKDTALPQ